jgi:meso-butanediol dehydrogenase/(S,S)-butanediol dehydrogenase/diacetyl reductase
VEKFGRLDALVNHAGIAARGSLLDTTLDDWRALMRVSLDGVFLARISHTTEGLCKG